MRAITRTRSHQSTASLAGAWKLAGGRAMSLDEAVEYALSDGQ